jgi:hypothetical protein
VGCTGLTFTAISVPLTVMYQFFEGIDKGNLALFPEFFRYTEKMAGFPDATVR